VKIDERLTKSESKKNREIRVMRPLIVAEVGGTSTFVTHDVTKVEVRWAETHLKLKSHAPKERGRLTPRMSAGLRAAQGQRGPWRARAGPGPGHGPGRGSVIFSLIFWYFRFSICFAFYFWCFMFCTCTCLKLCFLGGSLYFFVPTYGFEILFKSIASSIFFSTSIFSN
jgi:hypothetical protein